MKTLGKVKQCRLRKGVLRLICTFLLLLFLELMVRSALYRLEPVYCKAKGGDVGWRRFWIGHQRSQKGMNYGSDMYDSELGWVSKPNLRGLSLVNHTIVDTNAAGFRGLQDYSPTPASGKRRVVILGDSFTFGEEVNNAETYSTLLQRRLPHWEVLNLGVHGYGHDQMLLLLKRVALKYHPDVVLLGFIGADAQRNLLNFRDYAKPRFVTVGGQLQLVSSKVPSPEEIVRTEPWKRGLVDLIGLLDWYLREKVGINIRNEEEITAKILSEFVSTVKSAGAEPLFVYLPTGGETRSPVEAKSHREKVFEKFCEKESIKCFSTRPAFSEAWQRGVDVRLGHWNHAGHQIAASEIARYFIKVWGAPKGRATQTTLLSRQ